ncbi:primosomal replication protein N [Zoogloea sp. LCSB751]|uniref:primosomal replication protein N n=1 Tax=Zoogloea sp. LCSB751 TaxID=1965277 RepID=UPI0009A4D90D|nr:primosomal replication protein N [Zoogloea sp. LCSB751]
MQEQFRNSFEIDGVLTEIGALRYSPGGVPVLAGRLEHRSRQVEAGVERDVSLELQVVALGDKANLLASARLGCPARIAGFLAAKSLRSRTPVLHIDTIEFLEGMNHGIQASNEA